MGGGAGARLGGVGRWAGVRSERQLHAAAHPPPPQGLPSPPEPLVTRRPATAIPRRLSPRVAAMVPVALPVQEDLLPDAHPVHLDEGLLPVPRVDLHKFELQTQHRVRQQLKRLAHLCGGTIAYAARQRCVQPPSPRPAALEGDRDTGARRAVSSEHAAQVAARCSARPKPAYRLERDGSEKAQLPTAAVCGRTAAAAAEECVRGPAVGADVPEVCATRLERVAPCEAPRGRHPRPGRGRGRRERWRRPGRRRRRRGRRW